MAGARADQYAERLTGDAAFLAAASLMFFDSGNTDKAIALSDAALALGACPLESLVVDGSVALAILTATAPLPCLKKP